MFDTAMQARRHPPIPAAESFVPWPVLLQREEVEDGDAFMDIRPTALPAHRPEPVPTDSRASPPRSRETGIDVEARRWMLLMQSGDESGLRRLHQAFHRHVFQCALGIVRRDEVADEVASLSFMQVWTKAADYDPGRGSVAAWLTLIARSRSLDALRRANIARQREVSPDDDGAWEGLAADPRAEPLPCLERRRQRQYLQRAMFRLPPIQRQVLSLTMLEGLSQDEASRHLQMPLGTVKSHARRALATLRQRCRGAGWGSE